MINLLETLLKREPVPLIFGEGITEIDSVPGRFAIKRRTVLDSYINVFSDAPVTVPPTATGVLAGGPPATLIQNFNIAAKVLGVYISFDAGDQTPIGQITVRLEYTDSFGVVRKQEYTFKIAGKNTWAAIMAGTYDADVVLPSVINSSVATPLIVTLFGPTGFAISTELLNGKHPAVRALYNSDLYERLVRWQLNQGGTK